MRNLSTFLILLLTLAGCSKEQPAGQTPHQSTGYQIVATTGMVADIVRNVVGDKAHVTGIIGEGVDPHLYKPTRADVARLTEADAIFYSGLLLEGKMTEVLEKLADDKPVHAVTASIDQEFLLEPPEFEGHPDPHLWMDVEGWMKAVEVVQQALSEYDPANSEQYRENAETYLEQLRNLDQYARDSFATIPEESRVLVTAHDAFNYLGRAYEIEVMGIQGISTESEAGLGDLNKLVDTIVQRKISAVFVETSVADKNVKALIEGARSRGFEVKVGGELFSDAMGEPGTYEGTYLGMIDHNVTTIVRALGGQAPERGMNGKLNEPRNQ
ncbi:MAG: zinc ABC transporter substrate-binding protein [Vulcanimicrobiota bacterium]